MIITCSPRNSQSASNDRSVRKSNHRVRFLLSEVACDGGSVIAVADGYDLAIRLNEHTVNKGFAATEWCTYKPGVIECRVQFSVGANAELDGPGAAS
jgi:hypothetical protein